MDSCFFFPFHFIFVFDSFHQNWSIYLCIAVAGICDAASKRSTVSRRDIKIEWEKRNIIICCVHCYWSAQQYTGQWTACVHAPSARIPKGNDRRTHTCTNPHSDDEDDDVDLLIICCWLVRIDLPPLSSRCSQLACVLNFLSMLCAYVKV